MSSPGFLSSGLYAISTQVICPPGHLSRLLSTLFLLPPLRPYKSIQPPPSSSVWYFIICLSESYQPSGCNGRPMSSPGFLSRGPYAGLHPSPTCAARGTWPGCGRRGEGDGAPPPTPNPSTTSRIGRGGVQTCIGPLDRKPGEDFGRPSAGWLNTYDGRMMKDQTLLEGGGWIRVYGRRGGKQDERREETGKMLL